MGSPLTRVTEARRSVAPLSTPTLRIGRFPPFEAPEKVNAFPWKKIFTVKRRRIEERASPFRGDQRPGTRGRIPSPRHSRVPDRWPNRARLCLQFPAKPGWQKQEERSWTSALTQTSLNRARTASDSSPRP